MSEKKIADFFRVLESKPANALGFHEAKLNCWMKDGALYISELDISFPKKRLLEFTSSNVINSKKIAQPRSSSKKPKTVIPTNVQEEKVSSTEKPNNTDEVELLPNGSMKTRAVDNSTPKVSKKVNTLLLGSKEDQKQEIIQPTNNELNDSLLNDSSKSIDENAIKEVKCRVWDKKELEKYHRWEGEKCRSIATRQHCLDLLETFRPYNYMIPIYYKGKVWFSKDDGRVINQYAVLSMKNEKISVSFQINNQPYKNATQTIRHLNDLAGTKENEKIQGYLLFQVYVGKKFVLLQEVLPWEFRLKSRYSIENTRSKKAAREALSVKSKSNILDLGEISPSEEVSSSPFEEDVDNEDKNGENQEVEEVPEEENDQSLVEKEAETTQTQETVSSKALDDNDLSSILSSDTK